MEEQKQSALEKLASHGFEVVSGPADLPEGKMKEFVTANDYPTILDVEDQDSESHDLISLFRDLREPDRKNRSAYLTIDRCFLSKIADGLEGYGRNSSYNLFKVV